jgi:hypothetical protein
MKQRLLLSTFSQSKRNRKDYRRLQINAEFYRGVEMEAVYPAQKYILAAVIAAEATRSILLRGYLQHLVWMSSHDTSSSVFPRSLLR